MPSEYKKLTPKAHCPKCGKIDCVYGAGKAYKKCVRKSTRKKLKEKERKFMLEIICIKIHEDENGNTIENRKIFKCENILETGRYVYISSCEGITTRLDSCDWDYCTIRKELEEQKCVK